MGSGRDKRKKAKGSTKTGHGADKTARKTEANESKGLRRAQRAAAVRLLSRPGSETLIVRLT